MPTDRTCSHGHRWESREPHGGNGADVCPECGMPAPTGLFPPPAPDGTTTEMNEPGPLEPPDLPGYEFLGVLGQGGMGVVYKALHTALNRVVAVKMLLGIGDARAAVRFRTEAEAVARLQHPHIIQIFEVGEWRGRPYLALEFAGGGSLDRRLDGTPRPAREAARLLLPLARAVHSAHEHGVLHRDLKPGNVLLTEDGVPKVSDFSLAKLLDGRPAGVASDPTLPDSILGTPSYMAPEQAAGRLREVGPAADVWALGIILYELLVGRTPFRSETPTATLQRVVHEDPVPVRRLNPSVPRDLETICHTCLHKDRRRRYPSALALADDLHRFLDGKVIWARPVGVLGRLSKWARRRPAAAALLTVSGLALLAGLAGGAWYNLRLQEALGQAQLQRERAERHLRLAQDAVTEFTRLSDEGLAPLPHTEQVRRELLETQLAFCETLLGQEAADPTTRATVARAASQAGKLLKMLGRFDEADRAYGRAIELLQGLAAQFSSRPEHRRDLAGAQLNRGALYQAADQEAQATEAYEAARELLEGLLATSPDDVESRRILGVVYNDQANLLARKGRFAEALQTHEQAAALRRRLVEAPAATDRDRRDLAVSRNNLGKLHLAANQASRAREDFTQARDLLQAVGPSFAGRPDYQLDLAVVHNNLGGAWQALGQLSQAGDSYRQGLAVLLELTRGYPTVPEYREKAADTQFNLGRLLSVESAEARAAMDLFGEAARLHAELAGEQPAAARHRHDLALDLYCLGLLLAGEGRTREAAEAWCRAAILWQRLLEKSPNNAVYENYRNLVVGAFARLVP